MNEYYLKKAQEKLKAAQAEYEQRNKPPPEEPFDLYKSVAQSAGERVDARIKGRVKLHVEDATPEAILDLMIRGGYIEESTIQAVSNLSTRTISSWDEWAKVPFKEGKKSINKMPKKKIEKKVWSYSFEELDKMYKCPTSD